MTYQAAAEFSRSWGLVFLMVLFAGVLVYALWPANKRLFDHAARLPLNEEDPQ